MTRAGRSRRAGGRAPTLPADARVTRPMTPLPPRGRRLRRQRDAAGPRTGARRAGGGRASRSPCCATVFARTLLTGFAATAVGTWCRVPRRVRRRAGPGERPRPATSAPTVADAFGELAPHPDVEPALRRLDRGRRPGGHADPRLSRGGRGRAGPRRGHAAGRAHACPASRSARGSPSREVYLWAAGELRRRPGPDGAGGRARLGRRSARSGPGSPAPGSRAASGRYPAVYERAARAGRRPAGRRRGAAGAARGMTSPRDRDAARPGPGARHRAGGDARGTLVLGHGAGGGVESADLVAVTAEAAGAGWRVVPRRAAVAGGRQADRARAAEARRGLARGARAPADRRRAHRAAGARRPQRRRAGGLPDGGRAGRGGRAGTGVPAAPAGQAGEEPRRRADRRRRCRWCVVQGETDAMGAPAGDRRGARPGSAGASVYAVPGRPRPQEERRRRRRGRAVLAGRVHRCSDPQNGGGSSPAMVVRLRPGRSGRVVGWCG